MDTLQSLRVFREVVERESFTAAALYLQMTTATASKHIRHLERHLQAKLLNRTSRRLSLTEVGRRYYQHCCRALDTLSQAQAEAEHGTQYPVGTLKITLPMWAATPYFAEIFAAYRARYPQVVLSLHTDSRHMDLAAHGLDLALRITPQPEANLIVKRLTEVAFYYVASPLYVARHGIPEREEDLQTHGGLLPDYAAVTLSLPSVVQSNNALMLYQLALCGQGIAMLPEWICGADIREGRLQRLFSEQPTLRQPLYAAYLHRDYQSVKVRTMIDFLADYWKTSSE